MAVLDGALTSPTLLRELQDPARREAAWRSFLERYQPLIAAWCRRSGLSASDTDDVCGAVLARLVVVLQGFTYDPTKSFRKWLRTVVNNEIRGLWRRDSRHPGDRGTGDFGARRTLELLETPDPVDELVAQLDDALGRDLRRGYRAAERVRGRVRPETWQAYWRTTYDGEPAADVAACLGLSVAAVYMAKRRVAEMLRAECEAAEPV